MRAKHVFGALFLAGLLQLIAGCGKSGSSTLQGCGTCTASPTFLFGAGTNGISILSLDASGTPSAVGSQAGPNESEGIVADSSGSFLYVSDFQNGTVDAFAINPSTGALTTVAGSPFTAGPAPGVGGIAIDPGTKFLYVTLVNSASVAGFTIAPGTGTLTVIPGSPFPAGNTPFQAIVDSLGKFLYVSNLNDSVGGISAYSINSTTGALSSIAGSPFATQPSFPGPNRLSLGGMGKYLYVGMSGTVNANNAVSVFAIDPATGALSQIGTSPFTTGSDPQGIASDPAGQFLFTVNSQDNTVSAFTIDGGSGALSAAPGSPFATSSMPEAAVVDPTGKFLFVGQSGTNGLAVFSIAATGALAQISGSPFSTGDLIGVAIAKP